ncbi:MAG: transglycosylase SLT domain-containing protein [Bacteroidales bacterium]
MQRTTVVILLLFLQMPLLFADNKPYNDSTATTAEAGILPDDPILVMLDSMVNQSFLQRHLPFYALSADNPYGFCMEDIPYYEDSIVMLRLEELNSTTPFDLLYNAQVQKFIDFYAYRRRASVQRMLGLGRLYFPLFEQMLDKYNLPVELKYLAIVESALNPVAVSRAGAVGLWQFMPATGRLYGLNPGTSVDDRRDPYKATDAACRHFIDLYNRFGDWNLVLAAYNAGSGGVARAIKRSGGATDYWKVQPYLPKETQNYVPAFIAVCYVMSNHKEYNLFPVTPPFDYYELDTVTVSGNLTLDYLAEKMSYDRESLGFLNPALKNGAIYATPENPTVLTLPRSLVGFFIANAPTFYEEMGNRESKPETAKPSVAASGRVHIVKKGESLGVIASKYRVSVNALKAKNHLKSTLIHPGQKLIIP